METLKTIVFKFANDWSMNLASMVAYSLITAVFPLLLVMLSIAGLFVQSLGLLSLQEISNALSGLLPSMLELHGASLIPPLKSLLQITGPLAIISFATLLWLGSNLFCNLENAFSIIFRIRGRDVVTQRIMAFGMVILLAIALPISLTAATLVTLSSNDLARFLPRFISDSFGIIGPLTSLGILWLLFLAIYVIVPNFEVRVRQAWRGALTAAVLIGALQILFPLYFRLFLTGNARYGGAVALVLVVVIWLWFFALITIVGAQVNAVSMGLKATAFDLARTFELSYAEQDAHVHLKRITTPTRLRTLHARIFGPVQRRSQKSKQPHPRENRPPRQ